MFAVPFGVMGAQDYDRERDEDDAPLPHPPIYDVISEKLQAIFHKHPASAESPAGAGAKLAIIPVDVKEEPERFLFTFEFPGLTEKDIKVQVENGTLLSVTAEREVEKKEPFHKTEVVKEKLGRRFLLPQGALLDKATAKFSAGLPSSVLVVTVPREDPSKKQLEVVDIPIVVEKPCGPWAKCSCCASG